MSDIRERIDYVEKQRNRLYEEFQCLRRKIDADTADYSLFINKCFAASKHCLDVIKEQEQGYEEGWILPNERLPEQNKDVIATVMCNGSFDNYGKAIKMGFLNKDGEWDGDIALTTVIAWRYVPEPYKEEAK